MSKEHEHNFVAEKYTTQELVTTYAGLNRPYAEAILNTEHIKLFCTKCGETKDVEASEEAQQEANQ